MAETAKTPSISYRHNVADARHEIGVTIGGQFVPFATLDDARVAQLVETAENRAAADEAAEEEGA